MNRLHHVQRVFPCSRPLSIAHSLTLPLLLCLLPSLSSPPLPCSLARPLRYTLACFAASFPSLFAHLHSAKKPRCCSRPLLLSTISFICHFLIPFVVYGIISVTIKHKKHLNHPFPFPPTVFCICAYFHRISADCFCGLLRVEMNDFRQFSVKEHDRYLRILKLTQFN